MQAQAKSVTSLPAKLGGSGDGPGGLGETVPLVSGMQCGENCIDDDIVYST